MTPEERALQQKWEEILRKEGLGMSRGRLGGKLTYVGSPTDLADLSDALGDLIVCSKCTGEHTAEGDCAFRPQA